MGFGDALALIQVCDGARGAAGAVEGRLAYGVYRQLRPFDATTAYRTGFVEGYYLPQLDAPGTLGAERHAAGSLIAHPAFADVELDVADVNLARSGSPGHPSEAVSVENFGATLALSRRFGTRAIGSLGAGRNAMFGAFDAADARNVDLAERVAFGALQWKQSATCSYAVQYRLYSVSGMPTRLNAGWVSPAYHGSQLMVEQRIRT